MVLWKWLPRPEVVFSRLGVALICDLIALCVPLFVKRISRPKKEEQRSSSRNQKLKQLVKQMRYIQLPLTKSKDEEPCGIKLMMIMMMISRFFVRNKKRPACQKEGQPEKKADRNYLRAVSTNIDVQNGLNSKLAFHEIYHKILALTRTR